MEKLALSIKETASVLSIHADTVRAMIESGQLPAVRIGTGKGKFIIPRRAIDHLLHGGIGMSRLERVD